MRLTNPNPVPVHLPTLGLSVDPDEEVEATGDDAKSLQAQGWGRADKPAKKAAAKSDPPTTDEPSGSKKEK